MFLIYFHSCFVMNIKLFVFFNVRCCHIPFVFRDCKNLYCIYGGTNREVIPVKYGRQLTLTRYMHPLHSKFKLAGQNFRSNGYDFKRDAKFTIIERIKKDTDLKSTWKKKMNG